MQVFVSICKPDQFFIHLRCFTTTAIISLFLLSWKKLNLRYVDLEFYASEKVEILVLVFARNADRDLAIRWQYFITADGIHSEYPAHQFDDRQNFSRCLLKARHRRW